MPEAEIAYVADNEHDAQALERQIGGLVEIRQRVVQEVPFLHGQTFQTSRRLRRLQSLAAKRNLL